MMGGYAYRGQAECEASLGALAHDANGPAISAEARRARNVRNLGVKTFYRKADRWVDSDVKPEEDAKAVVVEQFSDEFFKLARAQSAEDNQYLTFEEPVTVRIAGKVYRVDPPKAR